LEAQGTTASLLLALGFQIFVVVLVTLWAPLVIIIESLQKQKKVFKIGEER